MIKIHNVIHRKKFLSVLTYLRYSVDRQMDVEKEAESSLAFSVDTVVDSNHRDPDYFRRHDPDDGYITDDDIEGDQRTNDADTTQDEKYRKGYVYMGELSLSR